MLSTLPNPTEFRPGGPWGGPGPASGAGGLCLSKGAPEPRHVFSYPACLASILAVFALAYLVSWVIRKHMRKNTKG